jgi:integration host factor subunit beta
LKSLCTGLIVIKSELVLRLAGQNPHLFQRDVGKVVDAVLDEIIMALARGDRVELRGFGSLSVKVRERRIGRNPTTGAKVHVPDRKIPYFRPAHEIRKRLNPGEAGSEEPASMPS